MQAEELIKIPVFLTSLFFLYRLIFSLCNQQTKSLRSEASKGHSLTHSLIHKNPAVFVLFENGSSCIFSENRSLCFVFENGVYFVFFLFI